MVKVVVGNNLNKSEKIVESGATLRSVLEAAGVDYTRGQMNLDGCTLQPGDLNKTFADFNITTGKCFLLNVVKADNS